MVVVMHCTEREGLVGELRGEQCASGGTTKKRGGASSRGQQKQVYACVSVWRRGRTGAFERAYARGRAKSKSKRHKIDLDQFPNIQIHFIDCISCCFGIIHAASALPLNRFPLFPSYHRVRVRLRQRVRNRNRTRNRNQRRRVRPRPLRLAATTAIVKRVGPRGRVKVGWGGHASVFLVGAEGGAAWGPPAGSTDATALVWWVLLGEAVVAVVVVIRAVDQDAGFLEPGLVCVCVNGLDKCVVCYGGCICMRGAPRTGRRGSRGGCSTGGGRC